MHFKICLVTTILLSGCGEDKPRHHWRVIDDAGRPESQSFAGLWSGDGANQLIATERHGGTFTLFHQDPFSAAQTHLMPLAEANELILPSQDGQYFLAASSAGYAVVKADGTVTLNPLPMTGAPQAMAFSPAANLAVLTDDQQSIVLLRLDATGTIQGSFKGSSQMPNGQWVISGAMQSDGTYAAALSGTSMAIIDIPASIAAQAWKVRAFDVNGASFMAWTTFLPGLAFNAVMILDADRLVTVNTDTGAILDQKNLGSATILAYGQSMTPYLITQSQDQLAAQKNDLVYSASAGKLGSVTFQGCSETISASWLDASAGLAVAYDPRLSIGNGPNPYSAYDDAQYVIARFHLNDGSALDVSTADIRMRLRLRTGFMFGTYASALGVAERLTYGTNPEVIDLTRYAFPALSRNYQP